MWAPCASGCPCNACHPAPDKGWCSACLQRQSFCAGMSSAELELLACALCLWLKLCPLHVGTHS